MAEYEGEKEKTKPRSAASGTRLVYTMKFEKQAGAKFLDTNRRSVIRRGEQKPRMLISLALKTDETLDGKSAVWKTAGSAP